MRCILTGLLFLVAIALGVSPCLGQARGQVLDVGFNGIYRPACWTQMLVQLTPTTGSPFQGRIEVMQEDLDKDRVIFSRPVQLNGNAEGASPQPESFWMYFIPQPTEYSSNLKGFPPAPGTKLNSVLKVFLCNESGKQLEQLPVQVSIQNVETSASMSTRPLRGCKMVLVVAEQSRPDFQNYQGALGINEDIRRVDIPSGNLSSALPENVLGYDGVDAILWLDVDPRRLSALQENAIEQYIREGGKLVISQTCRPNLWESIRDRWSNLLPVSILDVTTIHRLDGLYRIESHAFAEKAYITRNESVRMDDTAGEWKMAIGRAKSDAVVAWSNREQPYLVRRPFGLGVVDWVAQDLGALNFTNDMTAAPDKWPSVWDTVFDWPNTSVVRTSDASMEQDKVLKTYEPGDTADLGWFDQRYMELDSTGAALVALAVIFFIVYWVVAGPLSFLFLSTRKKANLSWFAFAALALIATGLTVIIVRLVLRGPPQVRHVCYVTIMPGQKAIVRGKIGLYIPRDGMQRVELEDTAPDAVSFVSAYAEHPGRLGDVSNITQPVYEVPVMDARAVDFPFRSTLKKLQVRWVGDLKSSIDGAVSVHLSDNRHLQGKVTNNSGHDLHDVYFAFNLPPVRIRGVRDYTDGPHRDFVMYLENWSKGDTIDLARVFNSKSHGGHDSTPLVTSGNQGINPDDTTYVSGPVTHTVFERTRVTDSSWPAYWHRPFAPDRGMMGVSGSDQMQTLVQDPQRMVHRYQPMMCLFDRIPPWADAAQEDRRVDFLRRGDRQLDVSAAVSGGELVILGTASGTPLPIPMEVSGERVTGTGITYYQFILPLDRSWLEYEDTGEAPYADGGNFPAPASEHPASTGPASTRPASKQPVTKQPVLKQPVSASPVSAPASAAQAHHPTEGT